MSCSSHQTATPGWSQESTEKNHITGGNRGREHVVICNTCSATIPRRGKKSTIFNTTKAVIETKIYARDMKQVASVWEEKSMGSRAYSAGI